MFTVYQDTSHGWRWRFKASNGRIIAASSESYVRIEDCMHSITLVKGSASAPVYRE